MTEELLGRKTNREVLKIIDSKKEDKNGSNKENKKPGFSYKTRLKIRNIVGDLGMTLKQLQLMIARSKINSKNKKTDFSHKISRKDYIRIKNIAKKLEITPLQLLEAIPKTNLKQKNKESDFAYITRLIDEQLKKISIRRKEMENSKKAIEKKLKVEKKPVLYGARSQSIDDIVMHYGRSEFDTFASKKLKAKGKPALPDAKKRTNDDIAMRYGRNEFDASAGKQKRKERIFPKGKSKFDF
jgi:hypothetical protein